MKEIFDAEVTVETRLSLRIYPNADMSLRLSDYSDFGEFHAACEELSFQHQEAHLSFVVVYDYRQSIQEIGFRHRRDVGHYPLH